MAGLGGLPAWAPHAPRELHPWSARLRALTLDAPLSRLCTPGRASRGALPTAAHLGTRPGPSAALAPREPLWPPAPSPALLSGAEKIPLRGVSAFGGLPPRAAWARRAGVGGWAGVRAALPARAAPGASWRRARARGLLKPRRRPAPGSQSSAGGTRASDCVPARENNPCGETCSF